MYIVYILFCLLNLQYSIPLTGALELNPSPSKPLASSFQWHMAFSSTLRTSSYLLIWQTSLSSPEQPGSNCGHLWLMELMSTFRAVLSFVTASIPWSLRFALVVAHNLVIDLAEVRIKHCKSESFIKDLRLKTAVIIDPLRPVCM